MSSPVICTNCGLRLPFPKISQDGSVRCPRCGNVFTAPPEEPPYPRDDRDRDWRDEDFDRRSRSEERRPEKRGVSGGIIALILSLGGVFGLMGGCVFGLFAPVVLARGHASGFYLFGSLFGGGLLGLLAGMLAGLLLILFIGAISSGGGRHPSDRDDDRRDW